MSGLPTYLVHGLNVGSVYLAMYDDARPLLQNRRLVVTGKYDMCRIECRGNGKQLNMSKLVSKVSRAGIGLRPCAEQRHREFCGQL